MQLASNEMDRLQKEKRSLEDDILKLKEDIAIDKMQVHVCTCNLYTTFASIDIHYLIHVPLYPVEHVYLAHCLYYWNLAGVCTHSL